MSEQVPTKDQLQYRKCEFCGNDTPAKQIDCWKCGLWKGHKYETVDQRPSKDEVCSDARIMDELGDYDPCLSPEHVKALFANAYQLLQRLQRQVDELSIHAEKWVKRALASTPEPAAMQDCNRARLMFTHWSKDPLIPYEGCNCSSCDDARTLVKTDTSDGTAQPPGDAPCPHPPESRAKTSEGKPWCAECGGFL